MPRDFRTRIVVDNSKAKREVNEFTRAIDRLGEEIKQTSTGMKKAGRETDKTSRSMKKAKMAFKSVAIATASVTAAIVAMKKAFDVSVQLKNVARDAVETKDKFEQVFSSVVVEAHIMSSALQSEFKLASATSQELLGNTGDLLVGFGFTEQKALSLSHRIGKLALDLRSFKNIQMEATEVSSLMISAMSGNMRAIRSLGVVLRLEDTTLKGLIKRYEKKLGYDKKQAVALAVLDEAYNQSFKSVGDFTRTQHQLANQERILAEQFKEISKILGDKLLPVALKVTGDMVSFFNALTYEIKLTEEGTLLLRDEFLQLGDNQTKEKMTALKNEITEIKEALEAERTPGVLTSWKNQLILLYDFIMNPFKLASDSLIDSITYAGTAIDELTSGLTGDIWLNFINDLETVMDFLSVDEEKVKILQTELNTLSMALWNTGGRWEAYEKWARQFVVVTDDATVSLQSQIIQYSALSTEIDSIISKQSGIGAGFLMEMGIDIDTLGLEKAQEILENIKSESILVQYESLGLSEDDLKKIKEKLKAVEFALGIKIEGLEESTKEQEKLLKKFHSRALKTAKDDYDKRRAEVNKYYDDNKTKLIDAGLAENKIKEQRTAELLKITEEETEAVDKIKKKAADNWLNFYNKNIADEIGITQSGIDAKLEKAREYVDKKYLLQTEYLELEKRLADEMLDYKIDKWQEEHEIFNGVLDSMFSGYDTMINNMLNSDMTYKEKKDEIWDSMKSSFIGIMGDILKEYIKKQIIMTLIGDTAKVAEAGKAVVLGAAITTALTPAAIVATTATSGGAATVGAASFAAAWSAMLGTIASFADGGEFTVPQGYPNDSYPMLVQSGEHVKVTPSGGANRTDELLEILIEVINKKPVANTVVFDDIGMSRYVERGGLKRSVI
jgi:hypothetical protein